jgi:hypothetical protein
MAQPCRHAPGLIRARLEMSQWFGLSKGSAAMGVRRDQFDHIVDDATPARVAN